ncbi:MAG: A24 family peptidase [Chloroflexi bacterium]|nr:A24 family peptidase [Chloroflexota bacterium]
MVIWFLCSLLAGWLVNLIADSAPERRSVRETWFWSACLLLHSWQEKMGLTTEEAVGQRRQRYALVWLVALLLGWFAYQRLGISLAGGILAIQAWFFLAIAVIDLEHRRVLNNLLLPALPMIVLFDVVTGLPNPISALLGGIIGFSVFLLLAIIQPGSMGMGDVKLAGVIGLATGLNGVVGAMMICMITGGLAAVFVLVRNRSLRGQTIAYAPYLVLGAWAALFYGVDVWHFVNVWHF